MKTHQNGHLYWSAMLQRTRYKRASPIVAYIDDDQVNCYTTGSTTSGSMIPYESTTELIPLETTPTGYPMETTTNSFDESTYDSTTDYPNLMGMLKQSFANFKIE